MLHGVPVYLVAVGAVQHVFHAIERHPHAVAGDRLHLGADVAHAAELDASTAVPVLLIMLAIERLGAATVAQTGMIGPLSTILMGVWLLGEALTPVMVVGTALVLTGIYVFTHQRKKH